MDYYFAPLEGITSYIYRNAFEKYYGGVKKYFAPFISPTPNNTLSAKELRDLLPEHNQGIYLVPQLLTNHAESFIHGAEQLAELGYQEINLNLGCPSGTVTAKGKGAGFLDKLPQLQKFLEEIYSTPSLASMQISIKTRIGRNDPAEFAAILELYNQFPVSELIVHPRIQKDFYRHPVRSDFFFYALEHSRNPVVYNGDLFQVSDVETLYRQVGEQKQLMLGRGLLQNPQLLEELTEAERAIDTVLASQQMSQSVKSGMQIETGPLCEKSGPDMERLLAFHNEIYHGYQEIMAPDRNVLFRMKELWSYLIDNFPQAEKLIKKLRKADDFSSYESIVMQIFALSSQN